MELSYLGLLNRLAQRNEGEPQRMHAVENGAGIDEHTSIFSCALPGNAGGPVRASRRRWKQHIAD